MPGGFAKNYTNYLINADIMEMSTLFSDILRFSNLFTRVQWRVNWSIRCGLSRLVSETLEPLGLDCHSNDYQMSDQTPKPVVITLHKFREMQKRK